MALSWSFRSDARGRRHSDGWLHGHILLTGTVRRAFLHRVPQKTHDPAASLFLPVEEGRVLQGQEAKRQNASNTQTIRVTAHQLAGSGTDERTWPCLLSWLYPSPPVESRIQARWPPSHHLGQRRQASMAYRVWVFPKWEGTANLALVFLQRQREVQTASWYTVTSSAKNRVLPIWADGRNGVPDTFFAPIVQAGHQESSPRGIDHSYQGEGRGLGDHSHSSEHPARDEFVPTKQGRDFGPVLILFLGRMPATQL
jgi:hypothetical protein